MYYKIGAAIIIIAAIVLAAVYVQQLRGPAQDVDDAGTEQQDTTGTIENTTFEEEEVGSELKLLNPNHRGLSVGRTVIVIGDERDDGAFIAAMVIVGSEEELRSRETLPDRPEAGYAAVLGEVIESGRDRIDIETLRGEAITVLFTDTTAILE